VTIPSISTLALAEELESLTREREATARAIGATGLTLPTREASYKEKVRMAIKSKQMLLMLPLLPKTSQRKPQRRIRMKRKKSQSLRKLLKKLLESLLMIS